MRSPTQAALAIASLLAVAPDAQAVELTQAGVTLNASYGQALGDGREGGVELGETLESALDININTEWSLSSSLSLLVSARARLDGERQYLDPEDSFSSYAHPGRPQGLGKAGYAELDEAYFELTLEHAQFRIGKQQIVWGALDGLKVTDVLNPQRFREFILEPFDESRIATYSAYADLTLGDWRLELAWLPDETTHDLAEPGDWFEFSAPRFRLGVPPTQQSADVIQVGNPEAELARGALRLTGAFGGISASLIAAHTLDYEPTGQVSRLAAGPTIVDRDYHDLRLYGLTLESAIGPLVLRAEGAYRPGRMFNLLGAAGLTTSELDQWSAAIAADINGPWDTFINLQLLYDEVEGLSEATNQTLVRPHRDRLFTLFVRKQFLYDTVTVDLRWYTDIDVRDGLYRAELSYALGDNTKLSLNVDSFYAARNRTARAQEVGLFGQFANRDRASVTLSYSL